MDADGHAPAVDHVLLDLRHVVGDVVNLVDAVVVHLAGQGVLEALADEMGQQLAVTEGEVSRALHRRQVVLPLWAAQRGANQLAVGQLDVVLVHDALEAGHVVSAHLVAEAARAAVNLGHDLARKEAHAPGSRLVEDLIHYIDLDEVVARAQRAQLVAGALVGAGADLAGIGSGDATVLLSAVEVGLGGIALLQRPARPVDDHVLQLLLSQREPAASTDAVGAVALELRRQIVQIGRDLVAAQVRAQQPDATVDVVADAAGGDDAVGHGRRHHTADGEAVPLVDVGHGQGVGDDAR